MAESGPTRWDTSGLGAGLALGLVGVVLLIGRDSSGLRPVHLLGAVVLAVGVAFLLAAVGRSTGMGRPGGGGPAPLG